MFSKLLKALQYKQNRLYIKLNCKTDNKYSKYSYKYIKQNSYLWLTKQSKNIENNYVTKQLVIPTKQ